MAEEQQHCSNFESDRCRSCSMLPTAGYRKRKQDLVQRLLSELLPESVGGVAVMFPETLFGSRIKAKYSVAGTSTAPVIGFSNSRGEVMALEDCPLHVPLLNSALVQIRAFVADVGLRPYEVSSRTGELKGLILVTNAEESALLLRLVLRSKTQLSAISAHLPQLLNALPVLQVVSVNLQPVPHAILEGPEEHVLTAQQEIWQRYDDLQIACRPQSFLQVTPTVAKALYQEAASFVRPGARVVDLFCGAGGFGLHMSHVASEVVGIERSGDSIAAAVLSAEKNGITNAKFHCADVRELSKFLSAQDTVVVNPPRRGLGPDLCRQLTESRPEQLIYSSCNSRSLAQDLWELGACYRVNRASAFDMFPLSEHFETLIELVRSR